MARICCRTWTAAAFPPDGHRDIFRPRKLAGPAAPGPHGFFSNIRMTSSGISRGGAVMRSQSACVIVGGMGERTGAGSAPRPLPKFEVDVDVAAEQLQHAADSVGMVIVTVATVIDRVFSASVDPALKQAQLSEKLGVVGQPDQASREQRGAFQVNFGLGEIARSIFWSL